jgi:hypothetical protein
MKMGEDVPSKRHSFSDETQLAARFCLFLDLLIDPEDGGGFSSEMSGSRRNTWRYKYSSAGYQMLYMSMTSLVGKWNMFLDNFVSKL